MEYKEENKLKFSNGFPQFYKERERWYNFVGFNEPQISINVELKNDDGSFTPIPKPQSYFNEAKLTSIALAVRFTLLLDFIRPDFEGKFLALDDLLVSLDMSNRDKVLDIILNVFAPKYKIYLFTHERSFFNMVKDRIESEHNKSEWYFKEIYGGDHDNLKPQILDSASSLARSKELYKLKDYPASVNYLRKELEDILTKNLPKKIQKDKNGKNKNTLRSIIDAGIDYLDLLGENSNVLRRCTQYVKLLLNPLSHKENDIDAYEIDIKKVVELLIELHLYLSDIKNRTKEIAPRLQRLNLIVTENDGETVQIYLVELQKELYCITQLDGSKKLTNCKILSKESRTFKNGVLEVKADYKNERWKKDSLEILYNEICAHKSIEVEDYLNFYQKQDGTKLGTLI